MKKQFDVLKPSLENILSRAEGMSKNIVRALFAGIGGFCKGFEQAGFETKWATDFDTEVAQTYRHNFPDTQFIEEDLVNLDLNDLEKVDVIHAGFPCQSFSQAGNRGGFNDPRGKLFDVMIDKIEASSWKPSILVLENSPFILMGEQGLWFEHIQERLNELGFWFSEQNAIEIMQTPTVDFPAEKDFLCLPVTKMILTGPKFLPSSALEKISDFWKLIKNVTLFII